MITQSPSLEIPKARRLRIARRLRKQLADMSEAPISQVADELEEPLHIVVAVAQEIVQHDFSKTPIPYAQ